jgi:hypothetical protein
MPGIGTSRHSRRRTILSPIGATTDKGRFWPATARLRVRGLENLAPCLGFIRDIFSEADAAALANIDRFGVAIGQAFQIADDLLDLEGDAATLGKAAGKDAAAGKATLVAALGPAGARARLDELVTQADSALAPFAAKADTLRAAARFIAARRV